MPTACFLYPSGKLPYKGKPSSAIGQMMISDANTLDNYNNGKLTQGCYENLRPVDHIARWKAAIRSSRQC